MFTLLTIHYFCCMLYGNPNLRCIHFLELVVASTALPLYRSMQINSKLASRGFYPRILYTKGNSASGRRDNREICSKAMSYFVDKTIVWFSWAMLYIMGQANWGSHEFYRLIPFCVVLCIPSTSRDQCARRRRIQNPSGHVRE